MKHTQAVEILSGTHWNDAEKEVWADLGCGSGTFTRALAHHLPVGSRIVAVDKKQTAIRQIPGQFKQVIIEKKVADFMNDLFLPDTFDGILMANSLHFVQPKKDFLENTKRYLKPGGAFLIVEYDKNHPNPWIPYPITFSNLKNLFNSIGFSSVIKLHEIPSLYNQSNIYSAIVRR